MRDAAHAAASVIFLEASKSAHIASSLTALALAPGLLKTTIPDSAHLSTGILFTPAPALAIARRFEPNSISCILAERTIIASGFETSSPTVYLLLSNLSVPTAAILFKVKMLYIKNISLIIFIIIYLLNHKFSAKVILQDFRNCLKSSLPSIKVFAQLFSNFSLILCKSNFASL